MKKYVYENKYIKRMSRKKIEYKIDGDCHICTSHYLDRDGYPKICLNGHQIALRKMVYIDNFMRGKDKLGGKHIIQICKNKSCINPKHLKLGVKKDYVNAPKGENSSQSILDKNAVIKIRASSESNMELSRIYNISEAAIRKIRKRQTWKHI